MSSPKKNLEVPPSWAQLQEASDPKLVAYWLSGIEDAFAAIVDRYQRLVFSVAMRIVKDEAEAEDLVQVVFLNIFRDMGKFDPRRGTLKMWLLQYAYSRSINRRHYLERRQFYSTADLEDIGPSDSSTWSVRRNGLSASEASRLLEQAFSQLTDKQRRTIELIYFDGLKFSEAVEKTGDTMPQVRHYYYRGLAKIRDFIELERFLGGSKSAPTSVSGIEFKVANAKPRTI